MINNKLTIYAVVCKDVLDYLGLVNSLSEIREKFKFDTSQDLDQYILFINEYEAIRTQLKDVVPYLKPRKVFLRVWEGTLSEDYRIVPEKQSMTIGTDDVLNRLRYYRRAAIPGAFVYPKGGQAWVSGHGYDSVENLLRIDLTRPDMKQETKENIERLLGFLKKNTYYK